MSALRKRLVRDVSFSFAANVVTLTVNALLLVLLPGTLSLHSYSILQLYVFYSGYVGVMHLGWVDGVYLRHGGEDFGLLPVSALGAQFWALVLSQIVGAVGVLSAAFVLLRDSDLVYVALAVSVCLVVTNARFFLLYILQATSRIREYAIATIVDRISYLVLLVGALMMGFLDFRVAIALDLCSKLASLAIAAVWCARIVFRPSFAYYRFSDTIAYISAGSNLLIGGLASALIIGAVRFGIERVWGLATFGLMSLSLNLAMVMTSTINSIAVVVFPILRNIDRTHLSQIYRSGRMLLSFVLLFALSMYFLALPVLNELLPEYRASFRYWALLLPICVYEGRMSLLVSTYLKALRMERVILVVNVSMSVASIALTAVSTILVKDLVMAVASILGLLGLRCIVGEHLLLRRLPVLVRGDLAAEMALVVLFVWLAASSQPLLGVSVYLGALGSYVFVRRAAIRASWFYLTGRGNHVRGAAS